MTARSASKQTSAFGQLLRTWRRRRGMTQLELAATAGSTPRYVSFVETGRSRPRRDVVLRLAAALSVPLEDRNALLIAAGLPAEYSALAYDDEGLAPVRRIVRTMLERHEPYPAWCFAPGLRIVDTNRGADRLFPGLRDMSPEAMVDFWYGSGAFRERVENWAEVLHAGIDVMRREQLHSSGENRLLERAEKHLRDVPAPPLTGELPVLCPIFRFGDQRVRTMSSVLRFDTASDATVSELKVELMFPADPASAAVLDGLLGGRLEEHGDR